MEEKDIVARLVRFSGNVQGVGFRYTANSLARNFNVRGYVLNLPDGDVELYAEGPESEVERFICAVRDEMSGYIRNCDIQLVPPTGRYKRFTIRFY